MTSLYQLINQTPQQQKTAAAKSLHQIADTIHKRSMVIIFSDMLDAVDEAELFLALQHLKHSKHEVILFHVLDKKKELDFEFENRPYRFVDLETGEELKLQPNQVKDLYIKKMQERKIKLKMKCAQYKIDFIEADVQEGFYPVLMAYLVKRGKMV